MEDYELCDSLRVEIPILMPLPTDLRKALNQKKSSQNIGVLPGKLDCKIGKMKPSRTTAARPMANGLCCCHVEAGGVGIGSHGVIEPCPSVVPLIRNLSAVGRGGG